jgi:hypothetical protein
MPWSGHYGYCFGTKRPWVQIPPPRQQNTRSQAVHNQVVMASGDDCVTIKFFSSGESLPLNLLAVHGGGRLPVAGSGTETRRRP